MPRERKRLGQGRHGHLEHVELVPPAVKPLGHDGIGPDVAAAEPSEALERSDLVRLRHAGGMGEDDLAGGGPISVDVDEQVAGLRDQAFGSLVEKRRE